VSVTTLEPYVSIDEFAAHFRMSRRWVEYRLRDGMPSKRFGRARRFQISQCEDWLIREGHIEEDG
jgi:hypothetical protein